MTTLSGDSDARTGTRIHNQVLELEQQLKHTRGPETRPLRTKLREKYVELILTDFDVSEERQVANTLWHSVFYLPYTDIRNRITNYGTNPDAQQAIIQKLRKFLADGIQFYHSFIRKVKRKYAMDNEAKGMPRDPKRVVEYHKTCHRLYIHLGDLSRYKEQYPDGAPDYKIPAGYYYTAISLWPAAGHPHNQLAVLATYVRNEFVAVYQYCRGLAAVEPVDTATANLGLVYQKNLQQSDDSKTGTSKDVEENAFFGCFVRMLAILHLKKSLDKFPDVYTECVSSLEKLPTLDLGRLFTRDLQNAAIPATGLALVTVQIASMIICCVNNSSSSESTYADKVQYSSTMPKYALAAAFKIGASLLSTCAESKDPPMLAGSLVFMEWLAHRHDLLAGDEDDRLANARSSFWKESVTVFNSFVSVSASTSAPIIALWEDRELHGFKPLAKVHEQLDFGSQFGSYEEEIQARVRRFISAGKSVASFFDGSSTKGLVYDAQMNRFFLAGEKRELKPLKEPEKQPEVKAPTPAPAFNTPTSVADSVLNGDEEGDEEIVWVAKPKTTSEPTSVRLDKSPEILPSTPPQFMTPAHLRTPPPHLSTPPPHLSTPPPPPLVDTRSNGFLPTDAGLRSPLHSRMMNGTAAVFPSISRSYDAFAGRYGDYTYMNGHVKEPSPAAAAFPQASNQLDVASLYPSLPADILLQLQSGSLRDSREAFARQTPPLPSVNHVPSGSLDFAKLNMDAVKEDGTTVRPSVRPPPGFGPIPARRKATTPPRVSAEIPTNIASWEGYNPSKLAATFFSSDFGGIWSNGNNSGYNHPTSGAATSYPFPGMGARTMQQQQPPAVEQVLPVSLALQQQYAGWNPNPALLGFDAQGSASSVQQLHHQHQDIEQQVLRQYRPPDPFVS